MSTPLSPPRSPTPAPQSAASPFARLTLVALITSAILVAFLYSAGWLSPTTLTPAKIVDRFEQVSGPQPGFRRNHAKGLCVTASFQSNGNAARLSTAGIFQRGTYPVLGRFSFGGGLPYAPDNPANVRGLGLRLTTPDGQQWRTAMVNLPVFPVPTPRAFYDLLFASAPDPATGKPDPAKMKTFIAANPEFLAAIKIFATHPPSSGFADTTFNSLNTFFFINDAGQSTPIRWQFVPTQPFAPVATQPAGTQATQVAEDKNAMFDALIAQLHDHPLQWHLILTIGQPGDPTTDAALPWPDTRERLDAGTLTLDHAEAEETSLARDLNFDPLILPTGIQPSADPLLSARSAVYSQSLTRRDAETKSPSAITPAEVQNGGHP